MKTVKTFAISLFLLAFGTAVSAQHNHAAMGGGSSSNMNMNQDTHDQMMQIKTETLKVSG
jgi:hypothetical protein